MQRTQKKKKKLEFLSNSRLLEDSVVEILRILPAKSVLRFKCVCKSWDSIISAPLFAKLHNCNPIPALLINWSRYAHVFETIKWQDDKLMRRQLPWRKHPTGGVRVGFKIWGSCNGVICFGYPKTDLNLWNPTTGEVQPLPEPSAVQEGRRVCQFGFGWDKSTEDFKVVRMVHDFGSGNTRIEVLSLRTKTWVSRDDWVLDFVLDRGEDNKMIFCNGVLHWLALGKDHQRCAVGFDLAEQKLQFLPLPRQLGQLFFRSIGVLGGDLCVSYGFGNRFSVRADVSIGADVWVMKEYGVKSSWTKLVRIWDSRVCIHCFEPLSLPKDGDHVIALVYAQLGLDLSSYTTKIIRCHMNGLSSALSGEDDRTPSSLTSAVFRDDDQTSDEEGYVRGVVAYEETLVALQQHH